MKRVLFYKEMISSIRNQGFSIRRRFALCMIFFIITVIAALFLVLSLFGVVNPADSELENTLVQELDYSANHIYKDMDQLAAYAVEFSEQMTADIYEQGIPFEDFNNNLEALSDLQEDAYETVLYNMKLADCSGAFYILNTTVNDSLKDDYYNGIYLKYANVGSDIMLNNYICMFRGFSHVVRQNSINLFSTWECEMKKGTFPQMEEILTQSESDPSTVYLLTSAYKLPDAWEKVRLVCVPISDKKGQVIGVCGFEISDPYFAAVYTVSDIKQKYMVCALLEEEENGMYTGQIAPNRSGYAPTLKNELSADEDERYTEFSDGDMSLIGKTKIINVGNSVHTVAVVMPKDQYKNAVGKGHIKTFIVFAVVMIISVIASMLLSRRYVKPFLRSMEQIKSKE